MRSRADHADSARLITESKIAPSRVTPKSSGVVFDGAGALRAVSVTIPRRSIRLEEVDIVLIDARQQVGIVIHRGLRAGVPHLCGDVNEVAATR